MVEHFGHKYEIVNFYIRPYSLEFERTLNVICRQNQCGTVNAMPVEHWGYTNNWRSCYSVLFTYYLLSKAKITDVC